MCEQHTIVVFSGLEYFGVCPKRDGGTRRVRAAGLFHLLGGLAPRKLHLVGGAVAAHLGNNLRGQGIHHRHAHAVQATGHLITVAAELAASMQDGQDNLERRNLHLRMLVYGDTAAIVYHRHRPVGVDSDVHLRTIPRERLVDGVVHHLVDQMMQTFRTGRPYVHARPLAHGLEAFEYLDVFSRIRR